MLQDEQDRPNYKGTSRFPAVAGPHSTAMIAHDVCISVRRCEKISASRRHLVNRPALRSSIFNGNRIGTPVDNHRIARAGASGAWLDTQARSLLQFTFNNQIESTGGNGYGTRPL